MPSPLKRLRTTSVLLMVALLTVLAAQAESARLLHKPAPRFVRTTLDGHRISLAALRGKVVLLSFWATWCTPCQAEMPRFIDWQTRYGPTGLQIVAVSLDDEAKEVRTFLAERRMNYPVVMGDVRLARAYGGILGLPVNFLIDRHGNVAAIVQGESDLGAMEDNLRRLLEKQ